MLDVRFKSFHIVSFFIGHEKGVSIVENYDNWLYRMLLKCYHYLRPMKKSKIDYVDQTANAKSNLNFLTNFQNNSTNKKTNHQKNIIFKHCQ
jgi:hypothetical protein